MKEYAVFWIPNGFDPKNAYVSDSFSKKCFEEAIQFYLFKKGTGAKVYFIVLNSIVTSKTDKTSQLGQVLLSEAKKDTRIKNEDILQTIETTGSPTDGFAVATFSIEHPYVETHVFATNKVTGQYFLKMYSAVAQFVVKKTIHINMHWPATPITPSPIGIIVYTLLRYTTILASLHESIFILFYRMLNRLYERRRKGFGVTLTQ